MDVKVLFVDDDNEICGQIMALLDNSDVGGNNVHIDCLNNFDDAVKALKNIEYDLVILDLFRGKPSDTNSDRPGELILEEIRKSCFIPVIFFTGLIKPVEHLQTDIVRVLRKSDGTGKLKDEISSIFAAGLPFIKKKIIRYVKETIRGYFWDFVQPNWNSLKKTKDETSIGYLIVRRLASSLSKERIGELLGDPKILLDVVHPREFYIYPPMQKEYEFGDIINLDKKSFIVLTPSCDFILHKGQKERKASKVLLAECSPLSETEEFKKYKQSADPIKDNSLENLKKLIECRRGDRYFFIPSVDFITNSVIDFQKIQIIEYSDLTKFQKVAKLDDPFAQSMQAFFIRYYNRIGHPDIDADYVLKSIG